MPGDAEATRQRLIDAATAEFAAHGLAGARVDRIAAAARANKAQIYHYFGSKEELYDAAFRKLVIEIVRAVPMDADDLPGYAGRLYDSYAGHHPELRRLSTWRRLEHAAGRPLLEELIEHNRANVAAIARAQREGYLSAHFSPVEVLTVVLTLVAMWSSQTPELTGMLKRCSQARRRAVIVDSVRAILSL